MDVIFVRREVDKKGILSRVRGEGGGGALSISEITN